MLVVLRITMLAGCMVAGAALAAILKIGDPQRFAFAGSSNEMVVLAGALAGLLVGLAAIVAELVLRRAALGDLLAVAAGLVLGALAARCFTIAATHLPPVFAQHMGKAWIGIGALAVFAICAYVGTSIALRSRTAVCDLIPHLRPGRNGAAYPIIVDTSAIIDGRVVELCKIGFLRGKIIVAEFVLHELQMVSDSQVPLTRAKGRRGLDTLKRLQDVAEINIEVVNIDYADVREVDDKLLRLARQLGGIVLTTDYNLEQVAKIQKIQCMNLFALVNAVKAPFIPGERLTLQIVKEGSEPNQGVGFLEDGTMIVVANARPQIGQRVEVELVSMIQGATGRMFFADLAENGQQGGQQAGARSQDRRRA